MSYIDRLLGLNEEVLFQTRKHFLIIFGEVIRELLVLVAVGIGFYAIRNWQSPYLLFFQLAFGFVLVLVLASMIIDILRWKNDQFFVTNRRVVRVSGVLNKSILDSSLSKINDVGLEQSWLGRIFNYGTVRILTATEDVINVMHKIAAPLDFKHAMLNAKNNLEPIQSVSSAQSTTQLLEELAALRDKKMITEDEYQEKRKEILGRI